MSWLEKVGDSLRDGFHAIPDENNPDPIKRFPAQHRLYNAAGMFGCFMIGGWLRDVMRGFKNNGEEIKRADVPAPARFLHGLLHHNPHSDAAQDRWFKMVCQMIPAVFGATGAILGSVFFFKRSGREDKMNSIKTKATEGGDIGIFEADSAASHNQSWILRIAAGVFATFSAASGMTVLYGFFLNNAFSSASNRKMFAGMAELTGMKALRSPTNTTGSTQFGAEDSLNRLIKETGEHFTRWEKEGKQPNQEELDALANKLVKGTLLPLLPEHTAANEEKLRKAASGLFSKAFEEVKQANPSPASVGDISKNAVSKLKDLFFDGKIEPRFDPITGATAAPVDKRVLTGGKNFINTLVTKFDIPKEAFTNSLKIGNNGWVGRFCTSLYRADPGMKSLNDAVQRTVSNSGVRAGGGA